jgi:excreted virulence factor EspC (type VII ESX diderm)
MGLLGVDTIGLRMLAAHCQSWAAEIEATDQPGSAGLSCQATSATVAAVHGSVGAAAQSLAGRMESTAEKLNAASVQYAVKDEDSAAQLGAVSIEV